MVILFDPCKFVNFNRIILLIVLKYADPTSEREIIVGCMKIQL